MLRAGIVAGFAAVLTGAIDLTASWLIAAYILVAVLGVHGTVFDRWTKRVALSFASSGANETDRLERLRHDRTPLYLLGAMAVLVVAIVDVMVAKPSPF